MIQTRFFELGLWIQKKAGAIMFIASLILIVCIAGLKSVHIEDNVEKLWIEGLFLLFKFHLTLVAIYFFIFKLKI